MIFSLTKQMFILLLSFNGSLVCNRTKCLFLNDELCMVRPTPIDMNPVQLRYYPFMISLNKCSGNFNVFSLKVDISKETKDINVTACKRFSCDCKCKFNITMCNSNQECNNKTCSMNVKVFVSAKMIIM